MDHVVRPDENWFREKALLVTGTLGTSMADLLKINFVNKRRQRLMTLEVNPDSSKMYTTSDISGVTALNSCQWNTLRVYASSAVVPF